MNAAAQKRAIMMAFAGNFSCWRSEARGDYDRLRCRDRQRRTGVLEGADTGNTAIRRARERGTGKHEAEGKKLSARMVLSPNRWPPVPSL
ncbi:hypothetical protein [Bradyrhizobium sp. 179]|uniref:hypothetical protein n=1 Tax=Bradyrhizobium sp. 179 TaxID=2782648 RepID=UPI001FFBC80F|nr:hypothetical protein [Bradyrhizobium sp. 179]